MDLSDLGELRDLDLSDNDLTRVPPWLSDCTSLEGLSLANNAIPRDEIDALRLALPDCHIETRGRP